MRRIARWTIGPVSKWGHDCLRRSIDRFRSLYEVEAVVCHNGIDPASLHDLRGVRLIDQAAVAPEGVSGVAWKLYPPRIDAGAHEVFIDNDLIVERPIPAIDRFWDGDSTLLLEGSGRHYGRFDRQVPARYRINSGLFGVPPGVSLPVAGQRWEVNNPGPSVTWDEQGFVACSLLAYPRFEVIDAETVTNCEREYNPASGMHFIGLNRSLRHDAYAQYLFVKLKLFL